jgi:hypothetical protein
MKSTQVKIINLASLSLTSACLAMMLLAMMVLPGKAFASNTSGVHGPNVKEGEKSAQFRIALSPGDESGDVDRWAYRLHYQQAFSNKLRGRVMVQYRDRGDLEYDYFRGELLYNFKKRDDGIWSSGVRFDLRTRRGDRPEEFAINWTNQWDLEGGYRIRGILIASRQFGSDSAFSGTGLSARSSLSKKLDNGMRVGVEMFNSLGKLDDFGSFNEQSQQFGPMFGGSIGGLKYEFRYLAGISNGSRDHNFGLRFNKSF